jgi:hypothetical protein
MMRGLVAVEVITPKAGPALTLLMGLLKFVVLANVAPQHSEWPRPTGRIPCLLIHPYLAPGPKPCS